MHHCHNFGQQIYPSYNALIVPIRVQYRALLNMLFILACLYILHSATSAAPISHVLRDAMPSTLDSASSQCVCSSQERSLWDILWSCLATIFACTWVSVHPNIPPSREPQWKTWLRRLELMSWALIAPELIVLWAMKQWFGARTMVNKYHGHGWTKTHAYFIQMGGFTLFEGGKPKEVLLPGKMENLLLTGQIELPQISEEEIHDRSKGGGLSKTLVIGQTSWFVAQCIARRAQGLVLTELELVTCAFAVLNGVMYFLWWNKPLDVRFSVPVHLLDQPKPKEARFKFKSAKKSVITRSPWDTMFFFISIVSLNFLAPLETLISKTKGRNMKAPQGAVTIITTFPRRAISAFFSRLADIADIDYTSNNLLNIAGSVPTVSTFYASIEYTSRTTDKVLIPSLTSIIAALFGGLHCAAWFFAFPSHTELMIWRICSAVISISPLGMLSFFIVAFYNGKAKFNSRLEKLFHTLEPLFSIFVLLLPVYAIARLLLLGEAFAALRYLPPDALTVVEWLSFLPHV
ncbi:hypothetical protein GALMADRAFT_419489 [Galerina marginata CBS 339.88]|uniref:Uncharacterized protein n=1 Tax=Galerina marginata (strain CBS 339.88) TaxID=685588 RepID=A0A067T1A1_GALM3|nr:hypothetical protein GALMADRAFT_419489 [Galerina marginata CBS 339.88]